MRLGWLRLAGVNHNSFIKTEKHLSDMIELMLINSNNIKIDETIFNEYLECERKKNKELGTNYFLHPLHNHKLFRIFFIFCMNSFINKSITIRCPFTDKIISTNDYFILTDSNDTDYLPRTICNYYFRNEKLIVGFNLGLSDSGGKGGGGPMHLGLVYVVSLKHKEIYNIQTSQYNLEINSEYFNSLVNIANNYYETFENPTSIIVSGFQNNIGHNMMNEMTGIYLLDHYNVLQHIDTAFIGHSDIFNIIYILQKYIKDIQVKNDLNDFRGNWKKGVCLSYNHFFMSNRFISYTRTHFNNCMLQDRPDNIVKNDVEQIKNKYYPIVNITIRRGLLYLKNQIEVTTILINKLVSKYPSIFILFDGFCNHSNNTCLESFNGYHGIQYSTLREQYKDIVKEITINIPTLNYRSLISMPFYDVLQYTDIATACISQIGSGCAISCNISKINGIWFGRVNANEFSKTNIIVLEDSPTLEPPDNKYIEYDDKHNMSNINIDILVSMIDKYLQ